MLGEHQDSDGHGTSDVYELTSLRKNLTHLTHNDWLLDVGGNIGVATLHMRLLSPNANIITLEPSPWNFWLLRLNLLQTAGTGRIFAMQYGLAHSVGRLQGSHTFNHSTTAGQLSWHGLQRQFEFPTISLAALMSMFDLSRIFLMKIDCEGCEWEVISSMLLCDSIGRKRFECKLKYDISMVVGELHSFCPTENMHKSAIMPFRQCFPESLTIEQAQIVWGALCSSATPFARTTFDCLGCLCPHFHSLMTNPPSREELVYQWFSCLHRTEKLKQARQASNLDSA
eukprot:gnl/TRDRNA2_/TRDRNA2_46932_c1_seq1.p1 gnl/TRDRNA2_/TRDRNA2_46932_c1~~gnl/TRDRNA2_/TRDRNA2_46932_c1_seq1.p1  ORF type:complete len:326 (+),score=16.75 gnl/TRDRNA2_/TRDRNA2_46932_c1_seq1:128-979(+)